VRPDGGAATTVAHERAALSEKPERLYGISPDALEGRAL
jgi:hypothetical protein